MRINSFFFRKIIFLIAFILIFNFLECSADTNNSIHLNESENLRYRFINDTPNESNINSTNYTVHKIDNSNTLSNEILDSEKLKTNGSLWSENLLNLATFLTSIISLFTLNELRKQRQLTSTPKLHIIAPKNKILVRSEMINAIEKKLPTEWESEYIKKHDYGFLPRYSIPLKIINTGSNSALNVKITWNYNNFEAIKDILKQFNELELGIKCEIKEPSRGNPLVILFKNHIITTSTQLTPLAIDYVFPFSNSNRETEILIPDIFSLFIILKLSILSISINNNDLSVPTLDTEITYYDNANIIHKENFTVKFEIFALSWKLPEGSGTEIREFEEAEFSIEAHKINEKNFYLKNIDNIIKKIKKFLKLQNQAE